MVLKSGDIVAEHIQPGIGSMLETWGGLVNGYGSLQLPPVFVGALDPKHFQTQVIVRYLPPREQAYEPGPVPGSLW